MEKKNYYYTIVCFIKTRFSNMRDNFSSECLKTCKRAGVNFCDVESPTESLSFQ